MLKKVFTNSFGILFSRITGFLRDLLTASILGANIYSDIFFIAFKFPNLFRRIFAEGAFVQSFLPSYVAAKRKNLFAAYVMMLFLGILLAFSILVTIFSELFTKLIAFGFDENLVTMAAPYVAINFYYLDLIFLVTFLAALLQHKEHFATTAFSTALLNISLIAALLIFGHQEKKELVYALSYAVLVGGLLQLLVHLYAARKKRILKPLISAIYLLKQRKKEIDEELKRFKKSFFPAIMGNSAPQISAFLDTWLASFLAAGSISYLYYANRLFQLPLALFAIAAATALFPTVSKKLNSSQTEEALKIMERYGWMLLFMLSAASAIGIILSEEIVSLLFERGSFSSSDSEATARILIMYLIGLVPFGLQKLFALWLYSTHRQKEAAKIATVSLGTNIALSLALIYPLHAAGLALASSLSGFVLLFLTLKAFGWQRVFSFFKKKYIFYYITSMVLLSAVLLICKRVFN